MTHAAPDASTSTEETIVESRAAECRFDQIVMELRGLVGDLKTELDRMVSEGIVQPGGSTMVPQHPQTDERLAASADNLATQVVELSGAMATLRRDQEQDKKLLAGFDRVVRTLRRIVAFDIALSVVLFVLGAIVGVIGHNAAVSADCQGRVNRALLESSAATRAASDWQGDQTVTQLNQQLALFTKLQDPNATAKERQSAGADYVTSVSNLKAAFANSKKTRQDNPLPTWNCS